MNAPVILSKSDKLFARANAAIASLRHAAAKGGADAKRAIKLADMLERLMHEPDEQPILYGSMPECSELHMTLAEWGEWIRSYVRRAA